jgi:NodT family efflux transporter outer membrane factor (OMF) lipoprotein
MQIKLEQLSLLQMPCGRGPIAWLVARLAATLAVVVVAGCASPGPTPPVAVPLAASAAGVNPLVGAPAVPADWWRQAGDENLARLIERAIADAPGLRIAQARLAGAQAVIDDAQAAFEPVYSAGADVNRQRYSSYGLFPATVAGKVRTIVNLQAGFAWELDFFGRHRIALEAALGRERAAQAEVHAARSLLAAQVAQAYVQLARLVEQRALLGELIDSRQAQAALAGRRVQAGLEDVRGQQAALAAVIEARQQRELVDEAIGAMRRALAHLSAQPPSALDALSPRLAFGLPLSVPEDVPADLLGRRADLDAARARVESAVRDVDEVRTRFYPNVNLGAFFGLNSIGLDRLLRADSWQAAIAPAIRLPFFEADRLRAQLRGRHADLDAAIATYDQALRDAVRDVADRIGALRAVAAQRAEQANARAAADAVLGVAQQRLQAGLGNRLAVLAAEGGVLAQRQQDIELRARMIDGHIALIRALGGGYTADAGR